VLSVCFLFPLALYILLPLRTEAGAALHWGDPNTLERFIAHVTARAHRSNYVFNKDVAQYFTRTQEIIRMMVSQIGIGLIPAAFGWLVTISRRWMIFFAIMVFSDLFYSIFLNIISVEITPFGLPSLVVIAVLMGLGVHRIFEFLQRFFLSRWMRAFVATAVLILPGIAIGFQYDLCDQSRNWMAHEHAVNIFRSVENESILFINGDNNIFPVLYSRIVEGARPDVTLYDRANLFFKKPEGKSETQILEGKHGRIYYAVFNPATICLPPGYKLISRGILYQVERQESVLNDYPVPLSAWPFYITESIEDRMNLDFMNRQVAAHYHFVLGKRLIAEGQKDAGTAQLERASNVGYNDDTIHVELAVYFTDQGDLDRARVELEKSLMYHDDLSGVYNNWGYFYDKKQEYGKAVDFYRKAIALKPQNHIYYSNLGLALFHGGNRKEANTAFQKSLEISPYQPELQTFLITEKLDGEVF
jgi:tetratricopeptide (TPR) repeat protein